MSKLERIIEVIKGMNDCDLIRTYNTYCENGNNSEDEIYLNDLDEVLEGCSPSDVAMKIRFGKWNPDHDYCWFNGYENIESGDGYMLIDNKIFPSDMARAAIDEDDDFGSPEIRELLDEMYFFDVDRDLVVTESEIRESYDEEIKTGEIDPSETTFAQFIDLCMTENNGTLVRLQDHINKLYERLSEVRKYADADGIEFYQDEIDNLEGEIKNLESYEF